ncbi:MAG: VTT domain-containing protein [Rhodobacter sp.]|jgi:membrane protein DedA with SNARE-associated domain|nr:VTT domain-containing protein [Rhodobacter sp.]
MTGTLLELVPAYGLYIIAAATFLSCLALPIPSSLIMLTGGAFAASGDLAASTTAATALAGAVLGDQAGYLIGRSGASWLQRLTGAGGKPASLVARAQALSNDWGGIGVFLSRWLFSPLGPYMNFVTGAARMNWPRFTLWGALGEIVWVSLYVGLGYAFAGQIEAVADIAGNLSGVLAAGAVAVALGLWLRAAMRADRAHRDLRRAPP